MAMLGVSHVARIARVIRAWANEDMGTSKWCTNASLRIVVRWSTRGKASIVAENKTNIPGVDGAQGGHGQPGMILVQPVDSVNSSSG